MLDELTIYNLSIRYPNTADLVREVEKMVRADAIAEFLDLFADEITEAEHFIETENGDTYGLTSNEICGCIERAKEQLKGQNIDKVFPKDCYEAFDDTIIVHTSGLDEGIRCAMCTNPMANEMGCDGGCKYNENMYKKVLDVIVGCTMK